MTKIEVVGADASAFKPTVPAFSVDSAKEYTLQVSLMPTSQRTYAATLNIHSNDPDTPVKAIALSGRGTRSGRGTGR